VEHQQAKAIADRLLSELGPSCERIEIAGSVRRGKPDVGDIEIVAVPKTTEQRDLFGNSVAAGFAGALPNGSAIDGAVQQFVLAGARLLKNGPRYKQIALPEGINLDLFLVLPPAQFGVIMAIRTGPAEFSKWLVTARKDGGALPSNCQVRAGAVWRDGAIVPMPQETDLFNFLGLAWSEPGQRQAGWPKGSVRAASVPEAAMEVALTNARRGGMAGRL